jgi:uncharacterized protein with NRDE domain
VLKGGTWLGVTENGFFAAVTNQRTYHPADPSRRSRGQLVVDVLATGSPEGATELVSRVDAREYNPFNLLFGDARSLTVGYARSDAKVVREPLSPGIWVLNNDTIGSRDFPKANRARELLAPIATEPYRSLAPKIAVALGDHAPPHEEDVPAPPPGSILSLETLRRLQALCVHTPLYGTSSSTLLGVDAGGVRDYRFAAGPPCVTPFVSAMGAFRATR